MTEAERLLLLLVADALLAVFDLPDALRQPIIDARHAIDAEAHAAPQSALQGGQGAPRLSDSGQTLDAASDAHSPGTRHVAERHGRWIVVTEDGTLDGWSYPTREAAEDAARNPDWADAYRLDAHGPGAGRVG